jgi:hypothetical protein
MMYSGAEISLGIGGLGIASYSFRIADDTPTDISCGSSASATARTRLFVRWILLGREVDFLRQPLEFWLISYAIVRR